jgi:hypothetical protein
MVSSHWGKITVRKGTKEDTARQFGRVLILLGTTQNSDKCFRGLWQTKAKMSK